MRRLVLMILMTILISSCGPSCDLRKCLRSSTSIMPVFVGKTIIMAPVVICLEKEEKNEVNYTCDSNN